MGFRHRTRPSFDLQVELRQKSHSRSFLERDQLPQTSTLWVSTCESQQCFARSACTGDSSVKKTLTSFDARAGIAANSSCKQNSITHGYQEAVAILPQARQAADPSSPALAYPELTRLWFCKTGILPSGQASLSQSSCAVSCQCQTGWLRR